MSVLSQFFSPRWITSPTQMPRFQGLGTNTASGGLAFGGQGAKYPGNANFWTDTQYGIGASGVQVDTDFAADTYKTIANVSGIGFFYGCISPAIASGTDTASFRITVDGAQYVVAWSPGTTNYRAGLGYVMNDNSAAGSAFWTPIPQSITNSVYDLSTLSVYTIIANPAIDLFQGALRFTASLLVEMKVTSAQTGTANQQRRAGVLYRLQP